MSDAQENGDPGLGKQAALIRLKGKRSGGVRGYSSAGTQIVDGTISKPKSSELIKACGIFLQTEVASFDAQASAEDMSDDYEIFNEESHPLSALSQSAAERALERDDFVDFVNDIFTLGRLQPECVVMTVSYIERMKKERKDFVINRLTWRRLVFGCLVLASKVWEDWAVWLVDFADAAPHSDTHDQGLIEKKLLQLLSFDVTLDAGEYARVYFNLRDLSRYGRFQNLLPLEGPAQQAFQERMEKAQEHLKESADKANPDLGDSG